MEALQPGHVIGAHRIENVVAHGGMGTIYRARDVDSGREVALKVLKRDHSSNPETVRRFLREGQLIARLEHPGIVKVFDIGKEGGHYFLVMEYVHGRDLHAIVKERGRLPVAEVLRIALLVADALDFAHRHGIVHRDIKPSNIILAADDTVRLTDFGIARVLEQETQITNPGSLVGTPIYMSPEQCRGNQIDGRSDLYSLGATLYILLSGRPPFSGKVPATLINQIQNQNPPPLEGIVRGLNPEVVALVKRLMAKHPAARYQTGKELCAEIQDLVRRRRTFAGEAAATEQGLGRGFSVSAIVGPLMLAVVVIAPCLGVYLSLSGQRITQATSAPAAGARAEDAGTERPTRSPSVGIGRPGEDAAAAAAEPSDQELIDSLQRRMQEFRGALLDGRNRQILRFVDPRLRGNPTLLMSLGRLAQTIDSLGPGVELTHTFSMQRKRADVIYGIGTSGAPAKWHFAVTWVYVSGDWFFRPQVRRRAPAVPRAPSPLPR